MSVAANRYAKALLDVLYPASAAAGLEQLERFSALLASEPQLRQLFENPALAADRRKGIFKAIADELDFGNGIRNFLSLLIERNRLGLLGDVVGAYRKLLDEKQGVVRAHVTSASALDSSQQRELAARLANLTGKQVRMDLSVDPSLIGGVVAQVGSTIYDGSIRQQLQTFKHRLIQD